MAQLRVIYEPVLRYLGTHQEFWAVLKEEDPLQLMPYLASAFERKTTLALPALANYKKWIKLGSFYHTVILRREELNHTPHLAMAQVPNMNQRSPNEDTCTVPKYCATVDYTPRLRASWNLPRCMANSNTCEAVANNYPGSATANSYPGTTST